MGDAADDYEMQQWNAARRAKSALDRLTDWCADDSPDACTGKKTISADGRTVTCECGMGAKNTSEI